MQLLQLSPAAAAAAAAATRPDLLNALIGAHISLVQGQRIIIHPLLLSNIYTGARAAEQVSKTNSADSSGRDMKLGAFDDGGSKLIQWC